MAFLRFTRDKRGYEHFYLVQPTTNRRGKVRTRILYWFRTPPNVKVGREPFDEALRRALEAQNPDVSFDWQKIVDTPIPSADTEKWRERRRLERAERAARQADSEEEETQEAEIEPTAVAEESLTIESTAAISVESTDPSGLEPAAAQGTALPASPNVQQLPERRRRRRRRGRHGRPLVVGSRPAESSGSTEPPKPFEPSEPSEPSEPTEPPSQ